MNYPCKTCPEGKTGKKNQYCTGCEAWREWFRAAWIKVCERLREHWGEKG